MSDNAILFTLFTCILIYLIKATEVHASQSQCYHKDVDIDLDLWDENSYRVPLRSNKDLNCTKPDSYICEVPSNVVSPEQLKTCNYRNQNYPEQIYRWVAGRGCLFYTPAFLFVGGENPIYLNAACRYGNSFAPCLELPKDDGTCGCFPFDPGFPGVQKAVDDAMVLLAQGRWERCFRAAADCCTNYMLEDETNPEKCQPTFDAWTCWRAADAGSVANEVCPEFAYSGQGPSCFHYSSKECYQNATWEIQTNYTTCSITPRLLRRYRFHIGVLAFSIISCLPAVFIFFFYKRLRITRVALHRNLLIVIIIRNVLVIVSRSEIYIDELTNSGDTVLREHGIPCRILAVAEKIAGNAVFTCMLIEGIYLHRLIVAVFRQKLNIKWLYTVGAVTATAPVIAWTVVMNQYNDHSCWVVYTVDNIQWILDAPRVLILFINTGLFADVLRVLLTKIRNSENINQLNTAKATLFLMPIFGTQFLLTALRPSTTNCIGEQIYYFVAYAVEGAQGFIVAMLYCYVNKEVRMLVKATYKKTENAFASQIRDSAARPSNRPTIDRRITYSTGLSSNTDNFNQKHETELDKTELPTPVNVFVSTTLEPVCEAMETGLPNEDFIDEGYEEDSRKSNQFNNEMFLAENLDANNNGTKTEINPKNLFANDVLSDETIVTKL